ncbi:unnamed protein product, partial [Meganyctiphanes norvegica]
LVSDLQVRAMAGQVLVIVALCAVLAAAPCQADADAQLLYNLDGSPRLEIINTGVAGQSLQGRYSYQAPGGTLVWVQYPINHQGYVPWTPAEYTYSVGHNPAQNVNLPAIRPEAAIHSPGHNPAQNVNLPAIQPEAIVHSPVSSNNYQSYVQPQVEVSRGSQRYTQPEAISTGSQRFTQPEEASGESQSFTLLEELTR